MSVPKGRISRVAVQAAARVALWHAQYQLRQFLQGLPSCERVQDQFLRKLLLANQNSDFGRDHRFERIHSYADFVRAIPPANYSYHAPYIERCTSGDAKALLGPSQKLLMFATTSGTTSAPKYIPVTSRFMATYHRGWNIWTVKYLADHPEAFLRRVLQITSPTPTERTSGGYLCGAMSSLQARHQKRMVKYFYATPSEIADIAEIQARCYVTMRFALMGDVGTIVTPNPSTLILLAQLVDSQAQSLIRDIHDGGIDESVELPSGLRNQLLARLRPNRKRSLELERLLEQWGCLLPKHYWDVASLGHWMGGTVSLYLPRIRHYYGDKPIRDIGLLASEGRMSIPLEDHTAAGPLDIFANFYEFIPEDELASVQLDPGATTLPEGLTILRAHELKKGNHYYILLSNHTGLCRYHIGDVIRVTDFIGTTPVIEFLSRGTYTSSITGEKLTEYQVVTAVGQATSQEGGDIATFTMVPVWGDPPYYLMRFERPQATATETLARLAERIDSQLRESNPEYDAKRQSRRLGPLQIRTASAQPANAKKQAGAMHHTQYKHRFLFNQPISHEETLS